MGLNKSMQQIINFTNKLNAALDFNNLMNVKIPGNSLGKLFGQEDDEGSMSLSDLVDAVDETGALVATTANIILCGAELMTGKGLGTFLGSMAMGATAIIAQIASEILDAVAMLVNMAIEQIIGTITNIISALHNLANQVAMLFESIVDLFKRIGEFSLSSLTFELGQVNCAEMFAVIAACFLNKFLGPYIDDFKEKAVNKINEVGGSINDMLYEELQDANVFANYANHEAFLLKKAELQIKGLTRQNLLENIE